MLPKINRLKKKRDFENIFKTGKISRGDFLIVREAKNGLGITRCGFVVSNKISPKAVVRNKIRRRLRDIVRKKMQDFKTSKDIVVAALPGIEKKDFSEIKEAVDALLEKAGLLKKII